MTRSAVLRLSPFTLALLAAPVFAQQAPPTSGQLLQQAQPPQQQLPQREPGLRIQSPVTAHITDNTPFEVKQIVVRGSTTFDAQTLHALVADGEGHTQTLTSLNVLAQRITDYYRAHGYPLSRAVVPTQALNDGVVQFMVIEARYDQVQVVNHSRVQTNLLNATLSPLQSGQRVTQEALDRQLLLLNDLPGVQAHAVLGPGSTPGTSNLNVDAQALPPVTGNLTLDDGGDRYTGRIRLGGNVAVNNLAGLGDQLTVGLLASDGHMHYGHLAYDFALNGAGTRFGLAYSALSYQLGDSLSDLDARGHATEASAWLSQAIVRSPTTNLSARLEVDNHHLADDTGRTDVHDDRHTWDWTASSTFDHRDDWYGGGVTQAQLSLTRGQLGFDNAAARASDAATADTQGHELHWDANVNRLQAITATTRLYVALTGQYSHHNLDSSEQLLLGGMQSVRGYEVSTLAGASGYLATVELRHDLSIPGGAWQGSVFADQGALWINPQQWPGNTGSNHATLSSVGVGLNWGGPDQWVAQVQVGQPVGSTPELAGKRPSTRAWVQLSKGF
ncbi:ShlB/FhaC/HecB family hemolysin secretion/activation protein [Dyella psychrodurans]|uniref:ShlB/FhaC/HecB family hemolysin secretion/activation protein n=1 Tax=Dyella psychrodurans TaxID=1927960 RepID=A0A370XD19_9GAMM|nr:ShlB/FhaC/HecB family hemolysin secretion/activation protein [Dyella psychrodurans]RDS86170.1 ShlB/FhaC/HecB family hemolysin secretion/activation protein [Dyella psychrodurans]